MRFYRLFFLLARSAAGSTLCATPSCGAELQVRRVGGQLAVRLHLGGPGADGADFGAQEFVIMCICVYADAREGVAYGWFACVLLLSGQMFLLCFFLSVSATAWRPAVRKQNEQNLGS